MINSDLIKKKLPQELWKRAEEFTIADSFLESIPDLIILVLNSKCMDSNEEKQSWFNLMPLMNPEQMAKLRDILTREKEKLQEIEKKYDQKKQEIEDKQLLKWQQIGYQDTMKLIQQKEAQSQQNEAQEADSLLNQI